MPCVYGAMENGILRYVGSTQGPRDRRWSSHRSSARRCPRCPLHRALRERPDGGWSAVTLRTLPEGISRHERLLAEDEVYTQMQPLGTLLNKQQPYSQSPEAVRRRERMRRFHETHPGYFRQKSAEQRLRVLASL